MWRAADSISATASSAALTMLEVGALTTITPLCVAVRTSTLSRPTPARATTFSLRAAASASASTCVPLRTRIASASAIAGRRAARSAPSQCRISKSGPSASTVAGLSSSAIRTTGRVRVASGAWVTREVLTCWIRVAGARRCARLGPYPTRQAAKELPDSRSAARILSWRSEPTPVKPADGGWLQSARREVSMSAPVLSLSAVSFAWPDGSQVFSGLDLQVPRGRSALVGDNGTGKSTLLRLAAGDLLPGSGSVAVRGRLGYLAQDLSLHADVRVDEHLGVAQVRRAIDAIEGGDADPDHFAVVGDRWDVEERSLAELHRVGLPEDVLDRRLGELSGGEVTQLALARLLLDAPDVLLLDEPTNNLDRDARERLADVVDGWRGSLLVVSHDRELLEHVDRVGELREWAAGREVRWYGGGWSSYAQQVAAEQAAAEQAVRAAEADVRRQRNDLVTAQEVLSRRKKQGAR